MMLRRFSTWLPAAALAGFMLTSHAAEISDEAWLNRVTYGATPQELQEVKKIGREAFLEKQLSPPESEDLPKNVVAYIGKLDTLNQSVEEDLKAAVEQTQRLRKLKGQPRAEEGKKRNRAVQQMRQQAGERAVLRSVYSPWQLREQLSWFWFNHFNVFQSKGAIPYLLADYEDTLRAHVLGNFRDLLEASLKHPAMLIYLDNTVSPKQQPNENYARELMELHTLGVDGGYSQKDVQELARVLTGVKVAFPGREPKRLPAKIKDLYIKEGGFMFNPAQHDFGDKQLLGHTIKGQGWQEVEEVLDILANHPATAKHVSRQLATYLVGDEPPKDVVDGAAKVFTQTKGDLKAVVKFIVESDAFTENAGKQFKSPYQYAISSVREAGLKQPKRVVNLVRKALSQTGEPLYGRLTPDGYALEGASWVSTGQMANRIAIAESVAGIPPAPKAGNGKNTMQQGQGMDASMQKAAEAKPAKNVPPAKEKLFLKLAGPEFMYR